MLSSCIRDQCSATRVYTVALDRRRSLRRLCFLNLLHPSSPFFVQLLVFLGDLGLPLLLVSSTTRAAYISPVRGESMHMWHLREFDVDFPSR
jgi:hypothetical protein